MKDNRLYLIHILECISRIEKYTSEGKDAFLRDTRTQDAVLRNLQILSQSTQRLSSDLKAAHPGVSWDRIGGFRNLLVHEYLGINMLRVWEIVEHHLPALKKQVAAILDELGGQP
jgi:uncharacterized protein with HEPN domain